MEKKTEENKTASSCDMKRTLSNFCYSCKNSRALSSQANSQNIFHVESLTQHSFEANETKKKNLEQIQLVNEKE